MANTAKVLTNEDSHSEPLATAANPALVKREQGDFSFAIAVTDVYEGPLDLLLDLVRKQDIDIYDIPILLITEQYTAYLDAMEELNLEVAAR